MWIEFTLSLIRVLCLRLIFLLRRSENNTPRVINPRPPIWISVIITICPNVDQCVYVSTTTRDVYKRQTERYIHTLGVAEEARKLAERYGDEELAQKAEYAGLLHDCAKDYPPDMKRRFAKEYHKMCIRDRHKRVLSLVEEMLGKNHVFYGDVITNIGVDYCALGDLEKAIEYHNEALEMKEKLVGENHPHYILTVSYTHLDVYKRQFGNRLKDNT